MTLKIAVHIGLPKTGSTTLQNYFFSKHSQVEYFGQQGLWENETSRTLLKSLLIDGYSETASVQKVISEVIERTNNENKALVISDEALSFGEFMLRSNAWEIRSNHKATAIKIKQNLGHAHVFIVLRNQLDWMKSMHRQGLKSERYCEVNFDRWYSKEISDYKEHLIDLLNYDKLVQTYTDILGGDNIHIFFFEDYKNSFENLATEMATILEVDSVQAEILVKDKIANKTANNFYGSPASVKKFLKLPTVAPLKKIIPTATKNFVKDKIRKSQNFDDRISKTVEAEIKGLFYDSNTKLFTLLNKEKKAYGQYFQ